MRIAEARAVLSTAFTAQVRAAFDRAAFDRAAFDRAAFDRAAHPSAQLGHGAAYRPRNLTPGRRCGPIHPGHDPRTVPEVAAAEVEIRRGDEQARVVFSYKVEQGYPPYPVLYVGRDYLTAIARRGHVLLDGLAVLEVCERDTRGRPAAIRAAVVAGFFDSSMHGWRAHADTHHARVDWAGEVPTVRVGPWIR
ncbi:MAG: hypothetical protein L0I76_17740 [Pseudonocardia sp.]|nr:hypothetical protein [Pseudonocardia sp.]